MNRRLTLSEYRATSRQLEGLLGTEFSAKIKALWHRHGQPQLLPTMASALRVARLAADEMGMTGVPVAAILLQVFTEHTDYPIGQVQSDFSAELARVVTGLHKVNQFYHKAKALETDNFRMLLLTLAEDVRVIMIMLAERLYLIRHLADYPKAEQDSIAHEVAYLYAPLAHRMGFYPVKTEMEERAMEHNFPDTYREIARKLVDTAEAREAYFQHFIGPLKAKLDAAGFRYELKSRTKSIPSIWNKMKKQHLPFEGIYDIFAIRLIIDCPFEQEKAQCWQVYSIVTDM
ncbi:MAG: bifunctional (p)ppGpp synthetase/guanosine-3',5'-bis(diphosphate) 3'-pyrophosphohydrolase [Paludibacteraceae bacterium]|nr:bifunctional (p)ppGpp synthetase/guanosine-3',5'-bis(diphosphate) 3'-pyrophosphohydrolase [Paludibacteraceae bacterium]